jgi:NAD(P)H-flavin reductase
VEPSSSTARLLDTRVAAPGVVQLTLALAPPWRFIPGQVAELAAGPGTAGYFAIASAPRESSALADAVRLSFLVKAAGSDSQPLMYLRPGDELAVNGPYGRGFELDATIDHALDHALGGEAPILFVTAGTAFAAVRSALAELIDGGARHPAMSVLVGVRDMADLCFVEDVARWSERGVGFRVALSSDGALAPPPELVDRPGVSFVRGRVQTQLPLVVAPGASAFLAGSEALEDEVSALLVAAGVALGRIQRNYRPDHRDAAVGVERRERPR